MKSKQDFYLIDYDGINLFYKGKWTGIEYKSVAEGKRAIKFLTGLPEEKVKQFIETEKKRK